MRRALLAVAVACSLAAAPAMAQFVSLMKGTPAEFFDDVDIRMFLDAARKTLDEGQDNQTITWENPKTKHHGDFMVVKTYQSKGRPCKDVRVRNEAQGRKSDNVRHLCSISGKWKILGDSQL